MTEKAKAQWKKFKAMLDEAKYETENSLSLQETTEKLGMSATISSLPSSSCFTHGHTPMCIDSFSLLFVFNCFHLAYT